jgi:MoaA/NifB/PqqE/SkfB family radical SAM enzyme
MNIPHDKFCVLPWVSLEASPVGTVRPCCLADDEIVDDNGDKFSLLTADFQDVQNSNHMRRLREQFLAGEKPQTCRKCWNEERAGRTSKRMHTLDRMKHMGITSEWTADAKPLMFLDLKLGNICNLKCRICGSWSSSQYAAEEIAVLPQEEKKKSYAYQMIKAGNWPVENDQFWNQIDLCLDDIRYIEFTGGEPFMIGEHFDMLQGIVDRGIAGQVEIHYNTNGTIFPENAEEIWQHFKTVEIAFSIDDIDERFEYQRTNAKWDVVQENIKKFFKLKRYLPGTIQLQVCTTVNIFNIHYLDQVAQWNAAHAFNFVYWNMMHDAWYYSIATLPDSVKTELTKFLKTCDIPAQYVQEFERITEFMNNGASTDGFMLNLKIRDLDNKRSQDFALIAPEMAELIGYQRYA